jgi:hypothetical protein
VRVYDAGASKPAPGGGIAAYFRQQPAADAAAQREFAAPRPAAQSDAHPARAPTAAAEPARPPPGDSDPACASAGAPDRARDAAEPDAAVAQRAAPAAALERAASGSGAGSAASEERALRLAPGSSPAERAARRRAGYGSQPEAAVSDGPAPEPQPDGKPGEPGRGGAFSRFRCSAGAHARRAGSLSQGAGAGQGAGSEAQGEPRAAAEPGRATEASRAPARKRPRTGSGCLPALAALGLRVARGDSGGDDGAAAAAGQRARRAAPGATTASCTGASAGPLPAGSGAAAGDAEAAEPRGVSMVLHEEWLVSEHAGGSQDGWPQALRAPCRGHQPPAHAAHCAGAYLGDMGLEGAPGGGGGALAGVSEAALEGGTEAAGDLGANLGEDRAALEPSLGCQALDSDVRVSERAPGSAAGLSAADLSFLASSSEAAAPSLAALPAPGRRGGAGARGPHVADAPQRRADTDSGCDAEPADASLGLSAGEASLEAALGGGSGGLAAASSGSSELERALRQPAGHQRRHGPESSSHATLGSAGSGSLEHVVGLGPSSSGLLGSAGSGSLDRALGWAAEPAAGSLDDILAAGSPLRGSMRARRERRLSADSPAPRSGARLGLSGTPMRDGRMHARPGLDAPAASPTLGDPAPPGFRVTPRRSAGRAAGRQGGRAPCLLGTPLKLGDDLLLPPVRGRSALRDGAGEPGSGGAWGPTATGLPSLGVRRRQRQVPPKCGVPRRGGFAHRQHVVEHLWRCLSQPRHLLPALACLALLAGQTWHAISWRAR